MQHTFPGYRANWHHRVSCEVIDDVIAGRCKRLIISEPPRHGKTERISRRLPAYLFGRNPDAQIIACSYAADLSSRNNRDVQRVIDSPLYREVFPDVGLSGKNIKTTAHGSYLRNSEIFEIVNHRGSYRSAGVGGGITGMGFGSITNDRDDVISGLGIIDDPFKNRQEAESPTVRDTVWEWYTSTFRTRAEGDAAIIVIATRWHEDDLIGRLLATAKNDPKADQWEVLTFPAIAEESNHLLDPRQPGEALWEEKYPLPDLEKIKASIGSYDWTALYQQRPVPLGGGMIKLSWFQRYTTPPFQPERIILSADTASKANEWNCPWVVGVWAVWKGNYYLLEVFRKRMEYPEGKRTIGSLALKWQPSEILIEDKSTGQSLLQDLKAGVEDVYGKLHYFSLLPLQPDADKVTRMSTESPAIESGRVYLPESAPWLTDYETEISTFPLAATNDQVDMTSQTLKYLRSKTPQQAPPIPKAVANSPANVRRLFQ